MKFSSFLPGMLDEETLIFLSIIGYSFELITTINIKLLNESH